MSLPASVPLLLKGLQLGHGRRKFVSRYMGKCCYFLFCSFNLSESRLSVIELDSAKPRLVANAVTACALPPFEKAKRPDELLN